VAGACRARFLRRGFSRRGRDGASRPTFRFPGA
jgi:hypothetical protein